MTLQVATFANDLSFTYTEKRVVKIGDEEFEESYYDVTIIHGGLDDRLKPGDKITSVRFNIKIDYYPHFDIYRSERYTNGVRQHARIYTH